MRESEGKRVVMRVFFLRQGKIISFISKPNIARRLSVFARESRRRNIMTIPGLFAYEIYLPTICQPYKLSLNKYVNISRPNMYQDERLSSRLSAIRCERAGLLSDLYRSSKDKELLAVGSIYVQLMD